MIAVTKSIEFDAGHRVPDHASKCSSPHGHRYRVEATIRGRVLDNPGNPENGMVVDFGRLKELMVALIHDPYDHAFIVHEHDTLLANFLRDQGYKIATVPLVPTAENLAHLIVEGLPWRMGLARSVTIWHPSLELVRLEVWETPTCSAVWVSDDGDSGA